MRRRAIALVTLAIAAVAPAPAAASDFPASGVAVLERWAGAVGSHTPGVLDQAADRIMAFTYHERQLLDDPLRTFLSILSGRRYDPDTELQRKVDALARASLARLGYGGFLKRAVLLHSDVAVARESIPPSPLPSLPPVPASQSPLLSTRRMTVSRDGEVLGQIESDWNWPFVRSLVGRIHDAAPADPFVGDWYHATLAFLFERRVYAEAAVHLANAAKLVPDDPRLLFDRAVYAEIQGMPTNQVLMRNVDTVAIRRWRESGRFPSSANAATRAAAGLDIPPKAEADAEAERLFRRALAVDPQYAEARLRLARVLIERRRHDEALVHARTALSGALAEDLAFLARLFAGRAEQALGRLREAANEIDEALRLYPQAQSALLAKSQVALLRGDVTGAIAPIGLLPRDPSSAIPSLDPWLDYRLATGREWQRLYRALYAAAR
ncbi:MAG TPA: tetratricopeptide repeat protein [Vicinamibacterales bacterium]|nr:tetratricopeptide repeat protein [Vicinamibacterales bacterium]